MEFDRYKANRATEIKSRYNGRFSELITRYNRFLARVYSTRFAINKPYELARLKSAYYADFGEITAQVNAEVAKITMPAQIDVSKSTKKALLVGITPTKEKNETKRSYELYIL